MEETRLPVVHSIEKIIAFIEQLGGITNNRGLDFPASYLCPLIRDVAAGRTHATYITRTCGLQSEILRLTGSSREEFDGIAESLKLPTWEMFVDKACSLAPICDFQGSVFTANKIRASLETYKLEPSKESLLAIPAAFYMRDVARTFYPT